MTDSKVKFRNNISIADGIEGILAQIQDKLALNLSQARSLVQRGAIAVLQHVEKTGDWQGANRFIDALKENEAFKDAGLLQGYFAKYGGLTLGEVTLDDEKATKVLRFVGFSGEKYIRTNFNDAKTHPYWKVKRPSVIRTLNTVDRLWAAVETGRKRNNAMLEAQREGNTELLDELIDKSTVPMELLEQIQTVLNAHKAGVEVTIDLAETRKAA